MPERRRSPLALHAVAWLLVGGFGLLFWSTAASTSVARIAALQVVEPYAFAVYHQIVHNLAATGEFFQTIHQGYDDSWTWSGHRAPALFVVAPLYALDPSVYGLARVQILLVLLGAIPAGLLARDAANHPLGLALGAGLYLLSPPVVALALQDYQDLVLALPCLVFCAWAMQARAWWWAPLGAAVGLLPREETVPVVLALAVLSVPWRAAGEGLRRSPAWRRWALNVGLTVGVVGAYVVGVEWAFPSKDTAYQTPLLNVLAELGGGQGVLHLDGWPFWDAFYAWLLVPLGLLAVFAPHLLLPAAGLVLFHLAMPAGHAIDRAWSGHCHHLAPAVAVLLVAAAEGSGRLVRWLRHPRLGRVSPALALVAGIAMLAAAGRGFQAHAEAQNFRVALTPVNPAWVHPAWSLAALIPLEAVPAVPRDLSILVSDRAEAYTYDGSLDERGHDEGLTLATHALIDSRQAEGRVKGWVQAMPDARLISKAGVFELWTWAEEAEEDPRWEQMREARIRKEQPWLRPYRRREDIPGVAPFESQHPPQGAHIPAIRLPSWWPRLEAPVRRNPQRPPNRPGAASE